MCVWHVCGCGCVCGCMGVCVHACAYYVFSVTRGHTALNTRIHIICARTQRVSCEDTRCFTYALRTHGVSHIPHTHAYTQGPYTYTYVRGHKVSCVYVCLYDLVCVRVCVRACVRARVFQESSNRKKKCSSKRALLAKIETLSAKRELFLQKESSFRKRMCTCAKECVHMCTFFCR